MCDIVLVDDEDDVINTIGPYLGRDYSVATFKTAEKALDFLQGNRTRLLITDLRMPGLNGFMLIDEAKNMNNDLKIILISGFIDTNSKQERELYKKYTPWCLSKPFSLKELAKLVGGILGFP